MVLPEVTARMRRVRTKNTAPELAVRRILHRLGARFRVCSDALPGRPDVSNRHREWCVFVHGCFWHGHGCRRGRAPKTNMEFWDKKVKSNQLRDTRVIAELNRRGIRVLVVWQCELSSEPALSKRLESFVCGATPSRLSKARTS